MESLRVLRVTRQTAIRARRNALQLLRMTIVAAPEELRDQVRNLTRMQLIRTCAAWRPETTNAADPVAATRIALKSLTRRILELGDEIAALDELIKPLVTALAPQLLARAGIGIEVAGQLFAVEKGLEHLRDRPALEALRLVPVERGARRLLDRLGEAAVVGGNFECAFLAAHDDRRRNREGVEQVGIVRRHKVRFDNISVRPVPLCSSDRAGCGGLHGIRYGVEGLIPGIFLAVTALVDPF